MNIIILYIFVIQIIIGTRYCDDPMIDLILSM